MRKLFFLMGMSAAVALGAACSSSTNGATETDDSCANCTGDDTAPAQDGGSDATLDGSCNYPDAGNDPRCPAAYSTSYEDQVCPEVGLTCAYPGFGDEQTTTGCYEAAVLFCEPRDAGVGGVDAAVFDDAGDADTGYWVFGQ